MRRGEVAVVTLAAGRRQPLDDRRRAWSRRSTRSSCSTAGTAASSRSTWPRPRKVQTALGVAIPHVVTTSYLTHAAIEHHLRGDRQLRPRRPGLPLARPVDRPAADPDDPRPDLPLGRGERTRRSTRTSRRSARPAAARSSTGPGRRARGPTTPTTCRSSGSTRPATSTRCPTCSATACSPGCSTSIPDLQLAAGPQHRHPRREPRPGRPRPGDRVGADAELRGHPAADRRPRRRPGPGRRPAPAARRAWPSPARTPSSSSATTTR